jgi:hypothetical protein
MKAVGIDIPEQMAVQLGLIRRHARLSKAGVLSLNTEIESRAEAQGRRGEEVTKKRWHIFRVIGDLPPTLSGSAAQREPLALHFPIWV